MVNKDRIRVLIEVIKASPEHFDMEYVVDDPYSRNGELFGPELVKACIKADVRECGTTLCMAGWALHLWPPAEIPDATWTRWLLTSWACPTTWPPRASGRRPGPPTRPSNGWRASCE